MSTDRLLRRAENSVGPGARNTYNQLIKVQQSPSTDRLALNYLNCQLQQAEAIASDMPLDPEALSGWMEWKTSAVAARYASYLKARRTGALREYFSCKSHALAFLRGVAPTKLVDGSWLYGVLRHRTDDRLRPLVRTYLEELGEGDPARNHVLLYRRLLAEYDCEAAAELSDQHYVQGAIQLALAQHADSFLPEVIGYNLGYEQLPLHLLITAFELAELNIDPYYFSLHVTVDNASTGHARKAVQTVIECLPGGGKTAEFMARVSRGYRLNDLGIGTTDVIRSFDLDHEVVSMLERKADFGKNLHSDYCRIGGRTVNEWLATPGSAREFLSALESAGWIKRNQDPANSRFWRLIDGPRAAMAGVFDGFEQQLLRDWIVNDSSRGRGADITTITAQESGERKVRRSFRPFRPVILQAQDGVMDDQAMEVRELDAQLEELSFETRVERLVELMAPASHFSPAGLFATREFAAVFR